MEQIIESFDYKIYTKIEGKGRPLLLLHGLWGSHMLFDNIVKFLADNYKIIRLDFPGHGNSVSPSGNFSFKEFSHVLNDILDQLGIHEKISLMGHSMGGFEALSFAREHKDRTASLVLMHTLVKSADHKSIILRNRQARLISNDRKELLLQVINASNFAPENVKSFPGEFDQLNEIANLVTKEGAIAGIHAINTRENSLPFMMKSKIPTLMIVGAQDQIYNPEDQLSEFANIPQAELLLLRNSGHLGFIEEKDIFISRVNDFLGSLYA